MVRLVAKRCFRQLVGLELVELRELRMEGLVRPRLPMRRVAEGAEAMVIRVALEALAATVLMARALVVVVLARRQEQGAMAA